MTLVKITVVFFSPAIPAQLASSARLAGGGRVIADRLRNWIALGCDVTVLTTTSGMLMLQDSGVDCPMVALEVPHEGWLLRRGKLGVAGVYLLRSVLTRNIARSQGRQDVVRTASPYIHDVLLAMRLRKKSRAVVVFIGHIFPSPLKRSSYSGLLPSLMSWLQQWIVFRLCRKSDVYIVTYAHHVRDLERMGIPADRIRTIELGMELGAKPDVVPQYDCVSIGRVNRMKGFDDLLKVWEEVTRQLPSASLLVIGQVSAEARTILGKSAAKNVQMYGFASEGEKNALLRSSRVFVSTSREE
ncbi:MAG: glycosyltransferase, partial [Nitrososphaerales archaeon]